MTNNDRASSSLTPDDELSCCKVESVVSVDERGQMVLPKGIREKANIQPGDKLAIISWERGGKICCVALIRTEDVDGMVKGFLAPLMKEITSEQE